MTLHWGGLNIQTPDEDVRLSPEHWERLECALILADGGFAASVRRSISGLEADLARESRLRAIAKAGRAARSTEMAVAKPDPAALDETDIDTLGRADAERDRAAELLLRAKKAQDGKDRKRARMLRDQSKEATANAHRLAISVGKRVEARVDTASAKDALDSALVCEARRYGEVDDVETYVSDFVRDDRGVLIHGEDGLPILRTEKATARRVNERTGLRLAYVKGDLDGGRTSADDLYDEGKSYAENYRTAEGVMTGDKPDVRMPPGPRGRQLAVAIAGNWLIVARGRGEGGTFLNPRQVKVLDLICGEDCSIKATADQLRAGVPSIRRTLRGSLSLARSNRIAAEKAKRAQAKTETATS